LITELRLVQTVNMAQQSNWHLHLPVLLVPVEVIVNQVK